MRTSSGCNPASYRPQLPSDGSEEKHSCFAFCVAVVVEAVVLVVANPPASFLTLLHVLHSQVFDIIFTICQGKIIDRFGTLAGNIFLCVFLLIGTVMTGRTRNTSSVESYRAARFMSRTAIHKNLACHSFCYEFIQRSCGKNVGFQEWRRRLACNLEGLFFSGLIVMISDTMTNVFLSSRVLIKEFSRLLHRKPFDPGKQLRVQSS